MQYVLRRQYLLLTEAVPFLVHEAVTNYFFKQHIQFSQNIAILPSSIKMTYLPKKNIVFKNKTRALFSLRHLCLFPFNLKYFVIIS